MHDKYRVERVINDDGLQYRWCVVDERGNKTYPRVNSRDCALMLANSLRRQAEERNNG
jgi:hypothetical protein